MVKNCIVVNLSFLSDEESHELKLQSPEEVASDPRILCWVMFFPYLGLASLNGLVL